MTDFALGFYAAITTLALLVFLIIYAQGRHRMPAVEFLLSVAAIACWPLLALVIAIVMLAQKARGWK